MPRACTGVTAVWCPIHGDCTCTVDQNGERPAMDDLACPLHAPNGEHPIRRNVLRRRAPTAEDRARAALRRDVVAEVFVRDSGRCRAEHLVPRVPCRGGRAPHEVIQRSVWRDGDLDPRNVIVLCDDHHQWVHEHIDESERLGLLARSWQRPSVGCAHGAESDEATTTDERRRGRGDAGSAPQPGDRIGG